MVEALHDELQSHHGGLKLHDDIERIIQRPTDVIHFWETKSTSSQVVKTGGKLRDTVSRVITKLGQEHKHLNVFCGIKGGADEVGRRGVSPAYIQALLSSKIVVVAQRDEWEDHYRLFEALIGGAMVMTDLMLSLPQGLENGTSLIEYTSAEDLSQKILYYLQHEEERLEIAKRGRFVAMSQHRSWHRIEEIVFGKPMTVCREDKNGPCPYVVHASEI
jgi:hypothetical protein